MDPRLDRLFSSLEAQFGAAVARAEEEAAHDLALSLRQDASVDILLRTASWLVFTGASWDPVDEVAKDHVRTSTGSLVPFSLARFRRGVGERPNASENTLSGVLQKQARRGGEVLLDLGDRTVGGRPKSCSQTHLLLISGQQEFLLPLAQIRGIRLSLADSADAS